MFRMDTTLNQMGLDELGWLVPIVRYQCLVLLVHLIGCDGARSLSRMRRTGNLEIKRHRANNGTRSGVSKRKIGTDVTINGRPRMPVARNMEDFEAQLVRQSRLFSH